MNTFKNSPWRIFVSLLPHNALYLRGFWFSLILFAVFFGVLLARIAAPHQRAEHHSQMGQAAWIAPAEETAVSYYRREWNLDSMPSRAYIQVEAPDSFVVYVNGFKVGGVEKSSTNVFDLMDVGNYLLPGKNVIAIRVERKSFPGTAGVKVNLRWEDKPGFHHVLVSNQQWRISLREERQGGGKIFWYERDFDGINWAQALLLKGQDRVAEYPAHPWASSALFQALPRGAWISSKTPVTGGFGFYRQFDLGHLAAGDIKSAWLGIASTGSYTIIINGARGPTIDPSGQYMDVYDIGNFLVSDKNVIEIETSNYSGTGRIAVAALVQTKRELLDFSSNGDWRIHGNVDDGEHVNVLGALDSYPYLEEKTGRVFLTPIVRLADTWLPGGLLVRHIASAMPWVLGVLLITLFSIVLRLSKMNVVSLDVITKCILPWKLADLTLFAVFLLPFDIRISETHVFNMPVALSIVVVTYVLFFLIMSEIENDRP